MSEHYAYSGQGRCQKCDARLLWFRTPAGKRMPVDQERFIGTYGAAQLRGLVVSVEDAKEAIPNARDFRR